MKEIPALRVPQRFAQLYRKHLLEKGVLDLQYCVQKLSNGTVTLPVLPSAVPSLNLSSLQSCVAEDSYCEIIQIQVPQLSKKGKVKSNQQRIKQAVQTLVINKGENWRAELEDDLPRGWRRHGDLVLLGEGCFTQPVWREIGSELWEVVACALGVKRLAQIKQISQDGFRTPVVTMLLGDNSYVTHIDNHIRYEFDITRCMFSFGNITEKLRIASFSCAGETVVDLYAGIGYFTLPYLVHAGAAHVHACEWNPDAVAALRRNLQFNKVEDRCTVHPGDNRQLSLSDLADRVNLGLIPSSEQGWPMACRLLRREVGGMLHIHHNVTTPLHHQHQHQHQQPGESPDSQRTSASEDEHGTVMNACVTSKGDREIWDAWARDTARRISALLKDITSSSWRTSIKHIEHVKSYAPHINHIVLDLECRPIK